MTSVTNGILWYNSSSGESQIWFMDGHKRSGRATVVGEDGNPAFVGSPFSIVGIKFFTQDRIPSDPNAPH